jgi:epoxyqueuosine reductase QueG
MNELTRKIKHELLRLGADIVGFGDLNELPVDVRDGLPVGISVAVCYPPEIIRGIADLPTLDYREWYDKLNERLDMIVSRGADLFRDMGYKAIAQTREYAGSGENGYNTVLPHKTVATRAGIGWIGKCALLVTDKYGSAIRLSSILTDAPLYTVLPINKSRCGNCMACTDACPGHAVSGKAWEAGLYRDEFFDPVKCRKTARERAKQGFGENTTICGKCIEVCPYTQRYLYPKKRKTKAPSEPKALYHFTCSAFLNEIFVSRYLKLSTSNLRLDKLDMFPVVWLTDSPNPENMGLLFQDDMPDFLNKTLVRFTLRKKPYMKQWIEWSEEKGIDESTKQVLIATASAKETYNTWYVSEQIIPFNDVMLVENLKTNEVYYRKEDKQAHKEFE